MPNNYFQFKQFTVQQENCAMKVCTDACLFGAWAAENIKLKTENILDIGTGTGLLSLMLVQKNPAAKITAIEIDKPAAMQAAANFNASLWKEQLQVFNTSIQFFNQSTNQHYDFIICNPPFFENDLKSVNKECNLALHSEALSLKELLLSIGLNLKDDGSFAVLLPFHRTKYFEALAASKGFYCAERVVVKQTPKHNYFRSMLHFTRTETAMVEKEIIIKNESNIYTPAFTDLLKDYYLNL